MQIQVLCRERQRDRERVSYLVSFMPSFPKRLLFIAFSRLVALAGTNCPPPWVLVGDTFASFQAQEVTRVPPSRTLSAEDAPQRDAGRPPYSCVAEVLVVIERVGVGQMLYLSQHLSWVASTALGKTHGLRSRIFSPRPSFCAHSSIDYKPPNALSLSCSE